MHDQHDLAVAEIDVAEGYRVWVPEIVALALKLL